VVVQTKRFRSGHVIEEFSVKLNKIICVCSWEGDADWEWKEHKLTMKEDKIEMTKIPTYFNGGRAV
jgi:hypothetical protein